MSEKHNIKPIYNHESQILILGSFPSVKSRKAQFFYHHPQNRFWKVLAILFEEKPLITIEEKISFLLKHHIAIWDVIESCDIRGSSDSSIDNIKVNDIISLIEKTNIQYIYTNGKKAHEVYQKYCFPLTNIQDQCLPSTSPANAVYQLDKLVEAWKVIL